MLLTIELFSVTHCFESHTGKCQLYNFHALLVINQHVSYFCRIIPKEDPKYQVNQTGVIRYLNKSSRLILIYKHTYSIYRQKLVILGIIITKK